MSGTDTSDKGSDNTNAAPAKPGLDTAQVDPVQSLKHFSKLSGTADKGDPASLDAPGTDKIFAKGTTDVVTSHREVTDLPAVTPIYKPTQNTVVTDRQVGPGPWDTINHQLQVDPGKLKFDEKEQQRTAADDLLTRFSDELKDGHLTNYSIWQNYIHSQQNHR